MLRRLSAIATGVLMVALAACTPHSDEQLKITYDDGQGKVKHWTLTCGDRPSGSHPDPAAGCAALAKNADTALPAVPPNRACTRIFGGPQTATISGTWGGDPIDAKLNRSNGCEIARWSALKGLLPQP